MMFFKGIWTGMLLTYIYCKELAVKRFPKAGIMSWIIRHIFVFILVLINIMLIPIMSIIMIIKVIRHGRRQVEEDSSEFLKEILKDDVLSDQGREDSVEVLQHLLDEK